MRHKERKMIPDRKAEIGGGILNKENDKYDVKSKQTLTYKTIITV